MSPRAMTTLLLVDDERLVLTALARTLQGDSYRILTTTEPREVLPLLAGERVDVIIADIDMPGMNGLDLLAQVKTAHPDIVRILITASRSLDAALRAINDGEVFRFLTKPWDGDEVRRTVDQAVARIAEVRRESRAGAVAARRAQMLSDLEREHPGITEVRLDGGVYAIDPARVRAAAARIPAAGASALWPEADD